MKKKIFHYLTIENTKNNLLDKDYLVEFRIFFEKWDKYFLGNINFRNTEFYSKFEIYRYHEDRMDFLSTRASPNQASPSLETNSQELVSNLEKSRFPLNWADEMELV